MFLLPFCIQLLSKRMKTFIDDTIIWSIFLCLCRWESGGKRLRNRFSSSAFILRFRCEIYAGWKIIIEMPKPFFWSGFHTPARYAIEILMTFLSSFRESRKSLCRWWFTTFSLRKSEAETRDSRSVLCFARPQQESEWNQHECKAWIARFTPQRQFQSISSRRKFYFRLAFRNICFVVTSTKFYALN